MVLALNMIDEAWMRGVSIDVAALSAEIGVPVVEMVAVEGRGPIVTGLLGLPAETAQILVMGFLRRDYGAAGLFQLAHSGRMTGVQAVVALTVMTLFVPCVANFLMMVRERGLRTGLAILGVVTPVAILTGAGLNHVLQALGIHF
jgi:ferrous iron transport protein B